MRGFKRLEQIAEQMKSDQKKDAKPDITQVSVREFIRWFGYERRGNLIVSQIRNKMEELEIRTAPDFEFVYIDRTVRFELVLDEDGELETSDGPDDPTVRIGVLVAANQIPTSVKPDKPLCAATTLMQMKDYSQLPVMVNKRDIKGVISWKSIGYRLALGHECNLVRECMDPANEISMDAPLFDAIEDISEHGYVLVRGIDRSITGIVTASDVGHQFMQLAGPFLAIGEIEGHLRRLLHRKFTVDELRKSSLNQEDKKSIEGLADMTFGDYVRLLQNPNNWSRLNLPVDKGAFTKHLDRVREIRNDVMHFDPDGLEPEHEMTIQDLARFFRDLVRMGKI